MTSRERILTTLQGGIPDRIGRHDYIWRDTVERWRREGLGAHEDPGVRFGYDIAGVDGADFGLRFDKEILEETEDYVIQRDENGVVHKDLKATEGHTPGWMDFTIANRADFERHRARWEWSDDRLSPNLQASYERWRAGGYFVTYSFGDPASCSYRALGQVNLFTQMMDDPTFVAELFEAYADLALAAGRRMLELGVDFDGAWLYGDLGYRNALLFSPKLYDQVLFPQHKRLCTFFHEHGKPVILHSCGRVQELIPRFIEAGIDCLQPLEAKAGQDVRELKRIYGKQIVFFGNMDVRELSKGRAEIRQEVLSKLEVARGGGYIYHSDHSVPPTVSFENYCYAMELVDQFA